MTLIYNQSGLSKKIYQLLLDNWYHLEITRGDSVVRAMIDERWSNEIHNVVSPSFGAIILLSVCVRSTSFVYEIFPIHFIDRNDIIALINETAFVTFYLTTFHWLGGQIKTFLRSIFYFCLLAYTFNPLQKANEMTQKMRFAENIILNPLTWKRCIEVKHVKFWAVIVEYYISFLIVQHYFI